MGALSCSLSFSGMLASRERPYDYAASATIGKQAGRLGNPSTRHNPTVGITSRNALKKALRHRNNSLFYKTRKGAQRGDLFMRLIHSCELHDVNAFEYLTELLRQPEELKQKSSRWMPWNYRNTLARLAIAA